MASLIQPGTDKDTLRRCSRTMSWVMASLETGELDWQDVDARIAEKGGLDAVAAYWHSLRNPRAS
ncbi:MAG: hypothetical protein O7F73_16935 [Gammaproteobacteria bacterium]|nr:hypothetical protein [Gammaproteobacteria bacterium]